MFLIVKLLIANGAAVNAVDCIGNTPLHLGMYRSFHLVIICLMFAAVCTNQVGIVTTLLSSGMVYVCVCCVCVCVCACVCVCCVCACVHTCVCVCSTLAHTLLASISEFVQHICPHC